VPITSENPSSRDNNSIKSELKKSKKAGFMSLGFGINAYFDILKVFIYLFTVLTLLNIPLMHFYKSFDGIKNIANTPLTAKMSLGNLGSSSTQCFVTQFGLSQSLMSCPYGSIKNVTGFSVAPMTSTKFPCLTDPSHKCSKFFNSDVALKQISDSCLHKESCIIKDFSKFLNNQHKGDKDYKDCTSADASM
jgi:hypothetical protein